LKHLLIILSLFFLLSYPLFGQSERPETIAIPVGTLGDISDSRKQIIQNTLSQELTKYFRLVPQDKFEEAQEKAFEELEYEECTEDQCIMMIQELLQVENVFSLQLVAEDGDTQLSLTWAGLDEKKVLTDFCEECKTKELNSKIELLVKNMVQQIGQVTKVETEPEEKLDDTTESYTYKLRGIIGSGSSDKTEFNNMTLHFVWEKWGFGLSNFSLETTDSGGHKVEAQNQSLDLTYDYMDDITFTSFLDDTTLTLGLGIITNGEANSSALNTSSTKVSGYRFMSFLGKNFGKWELLGGYQYSTFSYEKLSWANDYSASGGLVVIGFGIGF
jgi:hypothetical protein